MGVSSGDPNFYIVNFDWENAMSLVNGIHNSGPITGVSLCFFYLIDMMFAAFFFLGKAEEQSPFAPTKLNFERDSARHRVNSISFC